MGHSGLLLVGWSLALPTLSEIHCVLLSFSPLRGGAFGTRIYLPLHELILKNNLSIEEILSSDGISKLQPLTYLIKNGYLDESHYLYTSKFYEGRLTRNDHDFLVTIRDFKKPDPKQPIDTPNEVCSSMRPDDFSHNYALNVYLIDYLLTDNVNNLERLRSVIRFISSNFTEAEEFLTAYWNIGRNVEGFVRAIAEIWTEYGTAIVKSSHAPEHIALILQFVDAKHLAGKMNSENVLTDYLSKNGYLVYASDITPPENYSVLKELRVEFNNLASLVGNRDLLDFVHSECLYEINFENIGLLLDTYCDYKEVVHPDYDTANYSAISAYGSSKLKGYVAANLSLYLNKVFLPLPHNTKEHPDIIRKLLNSDQLSDNQKIDIISKQDVKFETFTGIPVFLWADVLYSEKINISWKNIIIYLNVESHDKEAFTNFLNRPSIINVLTTQKIDSIKTNEESLLLIEFVLGNDEINDAGYCKLIPCLTTKYANFPEEISIEKIKCLIKEKAVELSESSFEYLEENEQLLLMLLGYNISEYIANKKNYPISDNIRATLLDYEMSVKQKYEICLDATPEGVRANKDLARKIAELLKLPDTDYSSFDSRVIASAIASARQPDTSIQILSKCIPIWDRDEIMATLEQLPAPYSVITEYGKSPRIPDTTTNRRFANLLVQYGIVSSAPMKKDSIRIYTFSKSPQV